MRRPSEIARDHMRWNTTKMENIEINGRMIKTNFNANFAYWNGFGGCTNHYVSVGFHETTDDVFDRLVNAGYTYIRFVYTTTRVRGYHDIYAFYK